MNRGFIMTNAHLQLRHHPHIFACGDVLAMPEEKLAQAAEKHAAVVATNIRLLERNQDKVDDAKGKAKEASWTGPRRHSKDLEDIPVTDTVRQPPKLAVYEPADLPILISLGKYAGMFVWKGWALTGFLPAVVKEFVEWKILVRPFLASLGCMSLRLTRVIAVSGTLQIT
jgi:NADH dehydrogenase FAD-containing subunit